MNNIRKINLFFCLVFGFIFLFGNVSSVQAATAIHVYEDQVLEQSLDSKHPDEEVVVCNLRYATLDNGEREIICRIERIERWIRNDKNKLDDTIVHWWYEFPDSHFEISEDKKSAKIFVTVCRCHYVDKDEYTLTKKEEKFDLTFELRID